MPIHVRALKYVVERTGAKLIPAGYRAFRKYDVQTTNRLFGKSGGKGFRHGRDLGLILGEYIGDDLDKDAVSPPYASSRKKYQARSKYGQRSYRCRPVSNRRYKYSR